MVYEKTLILIKPDGVQRGLIGRIISRFEQAGLKIMGMKMVWVDEGMAREHYKLDEEWARNVYDKTKKAYDAAGHEMKYKDHMDLGRTIQSWNMKFLMECPVVAMVLEGPHAVELVRKMIGATEPRAAAPGTIRGDFVTIESYTVADTKSRVLRNLVQASDSVENGQREIELWFEDFELHDYEHPRDKNL